MLKDKMVQFPNVSLRKLSAHLEVSYGRLLKASREPIPGVPYDPNEVNYTALEKVVTPELIEAADWEALNDAQGATVVVKGIEDFNIGDYVYIRRDNDLPYKIAYMTKTHIVIQHVAEIKDNEMILDETPLCWSHSTFILNGPVDKPRAKDNSPKGVTTVYTEMETEESLKRRGVKRGSKEQATKSEEA